MGRQKVASNVYGVEYNGVVGSVAKENPDHKPDGY